VVVPVKDDHAKLSEVESSQVSWRKHTKGMSGGSDGILNYCRTKRIVRLKDGEIARRSLAIGEGKVDNVAGDECVVIWRETDG
jgi:hypothetical protein